LIVVVGDAIFPG